MSSSSGIDRKDTDVLIIGAGLVGAMVANQLADKGLHVAVVDANGVANCATRRAAGLATPQLSAATAVDTARGVDIITNTVLRHGLTPRACRVLHVASTPGGTDALRALYEGLQGRLKMSWETKPGVVPEGFTAGVLVHHSLLLDLAALTAKLLQHPRIAMQPNVEVQSLESDRGMMNALASDYTIRSDTVVLATNAYAGLLSPYLADAARVVPGVAWSSRPLEKENAIMQRMLQVVPMPLVIDGAHLLVTQTLDWRLRVNAWDWDGPDDDDPAEDVQRFLRAHLPDLLDYTDQWVSGAATVTQDGVPLVGQLAGEGRVIYALGAGMYGPAWAPIIAERVGQMIMA
jgi:glycine/D-amino acid oxidase-like deaminating enzyme